MRRDKLRMAHSFSDIFITFSIVSLFVFSTISFVALLQEENNAPTSILDNALINSTFVSLSSNISQQEVSTNTSKGAFDSDVPAPGFGSLIIFAIVGVAQGFTSIIITTYNILIILPLSLLGIPSQVANILGSILMMTLIFLAWRLYRVGS